MKYIKAILFLLACVGLFLCNMGCSTTNISEVIKAFGQDTNSVHVTITTLYGTVDIQRNNPNLSK